MSQLLALSIAVSVSLFLSTSISVVMVRPLRGVLNQLVGKPGIWRSVWPPAQISSVPFHDRKVLETRPTCAGWVTRLRQTGQR